MAFSQKSTFIAFSDDMGTLNLVHITTRRVVFSQVLQEKASADTNDASLDGMTALKFYKTPG